MRQFFTLMLCVLMVLCVPMELNSSDIYKSHSTINQYNEVMVNATSDATKELVYASDSYSIETEADGNKINFQSVNLNLDKSLDRFYRTLWINLGIENNYSAQQAMKYKIPIMLVTGYDGYYLNYFSEDGKQQVWSKKNLYSTIDNRNKILINFTLDDNVTIKDLQTREIFTGTREQLKSRFPHSCLTDEKTFNELRNQIINEHIKKDLEYYTYYSNAVAKRNNWNMNYDIPYWGDRAVDSIAFMSFIQGQVFVAEDKYNSYGFATSRIKKNRAVYGYIIDGKKSYSHKKIGSKPIYFANQYEAAIQGYSPDLKNIK